MMLATIADPAMAESAVAEAAIRRTVVAMVGPVIEAVVIGVMITVRLPMAEFAMELPVLQVVVQAAVPPAEAVVGA